MYIPRGIDEVPREGSLPTQRYRPQQTSSVGMKELEAVRNGARHTLRGLLAFQWATLFMSLAQYAALGAAALLAAAVYTAGPEQAHNGAMNGGVFALGGWVIGSLAFFLFLLAAWNALLGIRASHLGRSELGVLQRREVEAAERAFWKGAGTLIGGTFVTILLAFQEGNFERFASWPYATLIALAAAVVTGVVASSYFGAFSARYLRNLSPGTGKKSRRRYRRLFVIAWTLPIAFSVAGVASVAYANDFGCYFDANACGGQIWTLSSPGFGPPFYLIGELVYDQYMSFYLALGLVAGGLLFSRVLGVLALASYRSQLRTAELVVRARIRANAPTEAPPG